MQEIYILAVYFVDNFRVSWYHSFFYSGVRFLPSEFTPPNPKHRESTFPGRIGLRRRARGKRYSEMVQCR
jgi:hypothetical protein